MYNVNVEIYIYIYVLMSVLFHSWCTIILPKFLVIPRCITIYVKLIELIHLHLTLKFKIVGTEHSIILEGMIERSAENEGQERVM